MVHADLVLLAGDRHQYVLRLEHLHQLEATSCDQLVHLALAAAIQEHQARLGADQQVNAPQGRAQDLRRELLLVFADLRGVGVADAGVRRHVDVDVRAFL